MNEKVNHDPQAEHSQPQADEVQDQAPGTDTSSGLPSQEVFNDLRQRANGGETKAQSLLKRMLDAHPELWQKIGDLAAHAQLNLIRLITQGDFLFGEAIQRKADELRRQLAGPFPTPLELLAVERVVAAWLQVQHINTQCAQAEGRIESATLWLKRQAQANRLLDVALRSLTLIQKIQPPIPEPLAATDLPGGRRAAGTGPADAMPSQGRSRVNGSHVPAANGPAPLRNGHKRAVVPGAGGEHAEHHQQADDAAGHNGHPANRVANLLGAKPGAAAMA